MLRALLALCAIVVCGWFALGARQAHDIAAATTVLSAANRIDHAGATRVLSLLHDAGALDPDREVDLLRAQLAIERGDHRGAERILSGVVAAEPMNAQAWALVAQAATDGATLRRAYARIEALVPTVRAAH